MKIAADKIIATKYMPENTSGNCHIHLVAGITPESWPGHGCYLADDGTWDTSVHEARQFDSALEARQEARRRGQ